MVRLRLALLTIFVFLVASSSFAYVQVLHKRITGHAFDRAVLESDFLVRYQLTSIADELKTAMQYGAVHEDDFPRSVNHFYDFQNGVPLTEPSLPLIICSPYGIRADHWALDNSILNDHSLYSARANFYRALTGRTEGDRASFAHGLFEDLGHVVHLLQDMAQPEHTRNDQHLVLFGLSYNFGKTASSLYENWTGDNFASDIDSTSSLPDGALKALFFQGYPTIHKASYSSYFGDDYSGLAAYSALNHVTQDTNYDDKSGCFLSHPSPSRNSAVPRDQARLITVVDPGTTLVSHISVIETIYTLMFTDYATGFADKDGYHTIESALDYETVKYDPSMKVFSLSDDSWETRAANLLPKAVSYSAGVIEKFFEPTTLISYWLPNDDGSYSVSVGSRDAMSNVTFDLLQKDDAGQLSPLAPPVSAASVPVLYGQPLPGDFGTIAAATLSDPEILTREVRVVAIGSVRTAGVTDPLVVVAQIIPKRHKLSVVLQFDTSTGYLGSGVGMAIGRFGSDLNDPFADYNDYVSGNQSPGIPSYLREIPFSNITRPPLNGTIEFDAGVTDTDRFEVSISAGAADVSKLKTGTISVLRDGVVAWKLPLSYRFGIYENFIVDGQGNVTVAGSNNYAITQGRITE